MDRLRIPFFVAAVVCLVLAVLVELSASQLLVLITRGDEPPETPGLGIRYLAIIDGILLYTVIIMAIGATSEQVRATLGRIQGIASLVVSFLGLIASIGLIFLAFGLLILMVTLLVSVPFGTIAYIAAFGRFATGEAAATLLMTMVLKIAFCILLALSQQAYLKHKGLLVISAASLGLTWVVGFLHAFPPGFLVSIADAIGALIIAVVGAVWLLVLLIASLLAMLDAARSARFS